MTQTNDEGGTDDEEFRVAAVLDRVNTTWQAWQGVTFGCVQCHSHPYDPIRHEEYYRFAAFFNNTSDSDLSEEFPTIPAPIDRDDHPRATELISQLGADEEALWRHEHAIVGDESLWRPAGDLKLSTNNDVELVLEKRDGREVFRTEGTVPRQTVEIIEAAPPEGMAQMTGVRVIGMPLDLEKAATDSEWGFVWSHIKLELVRPDAEPEPIDVARVVADEARPFLNPQESLNPESGHGFSAYTRIFQPRSAVLLLKEPVEVDADTRLRVTLEHHQSALGTFPLVTRRGAIDISGDDRLTELIEDETSRKLREQIKQRKSELRKIPSVSTPVLAERPSDLARPQHVFVRGLFLDKGERVDPATPESLHDLAAEGQPTRLDLAEWFTDEQNPLTARVAVNRVWARLFGMGLVRTEEDFGSSGERPSHPELLDHLAVRFQDDLDWSLKSLLKEITLSSTYRQSSKAAPAEYERDPENRCSPAALGSACRSKPSATSRSPRPDSSTTPSTAPP